MTNQQMQTRSEVNVEEKLESLIAIDLSQKHFGNAHPIVDVATAQQRFQVIAANESRWFLIDSNWNDLEQAQRYIATQEGLPFKQEPASGFNSLFSPQIS